MKKIKYIFLLLCFFILNIFLVEINLKGVTNMSDYIGITGAQIRTEGDKGIRFVGEIDSSFSENVTSYGIAIAFGEVKAEQLLLDSTINGKEVLYAECDELDENRNYFISILRVPEDMYTQKITARAYVKNGNNITYSSNVTVRSLAQVTLEAKNDNENGTNIDDVINSINNNYMKSYNDMFGKFVIDKSIYEYDPKNLGNQFVKDYNKVMNESIGLNNLATSLMGANSGDQTKDNLETSNLYLFLNSDGMINKWGWLFDYLVTKTTNNYAKTQNDLLKGKSTNYSLWYGGRHLLSRLQNFFTMTKVTATSYVGADFLEDANYSDLKTYIDSLETKGVYSCGEYNFNKIGENVTLPSALKAEEGYQFDGWYLEETKYESNETYKVTNLNVKFEPRFTELTFSIDNRLESSKLELTTFINSIGEIKQNIALPTSNKTYGTTISYSSSNTAVLSNTGVFDRPYKATTVTLTATISYNGSSVTETYKFNIDGYKELKNIASSYVYTNYDKVTDEFFETMDIIYCAFMLIDVDGGFTGKDGAGNSIKSTNARYKEYMKTHILPKAHAKGDWVVISVGGGGSAYDKAFEAICDDDAKIDTLVKNIIALINECGFDGVDIDWEIPDTGTDFTKLMEKLYPAVKANNPNHIVTAAIGGGKWQPPKYDLTNSSKYLDFINVMTYSMTSEAGYHHTALYKSSTYFDPTNKVAKTLVSCSIEESVKIYNDTYGIPSSKLIVGGAFYASKQTRTSKDATWKSSGSISYTNIKNTYLKDPNYTYYYDTNCQAPYLLSKDGLTFISYDDPTSIKAKCEYILKNDLAGFMYWQNGQDTTGDLVKAIKEGLKK